MTLITKDGTYYYVAYNEGVVLLLQTELCNLQRNGEQKKIYYKPNYAHSNSLSLKIQKST